MGTNTHKKRLAKQARRFKNVSTLNIRFREEIRRKIIPVPVIPRLQAMAFSPYNMRNEGTACYIAH